MTASARQRFLEGAPLLLKPAAVSDLAIAKLATAAVASNPILSEEQVRGGGRNARVNQSRKRVSGISPDDSPSRTIGCRWPYRKSSGKCRTLTFFAANTLRELAPLRNIKTFDDCAEPVDVKTSLWKHEEKLRRIVKNE
jgi:hypothetical protein